MKKMIAIYLTIIFLIIIDRFLKAWALTSAQSQIIIPGFLNFNFVKNYYIAFSLPISGVLLEIFIFLIIIFLFFYFVNLFKQKDYLKSGFVLSIAYGAASNLFDRLRYGFVIDHFDLKYFTVFNLADVMIVAGTILLIIMLANKKTIKV